MTGCEDTPARVGLFGGTFDPIHTGHLEIARAARDGHDLDRVILIPARQQPIKASGPVASGEHRLAMIEAAIREEPGFTASDCELRRPGKSFTIDTVRAFRDDLGPTVRLFFILGSDSLPELRYWRQLERLVTLCTLVVAARPGWPLDELDKLAGVLSDEDVATLKAAMVRTTASGASSTEVRNRLAGFEAIDGLVPGPVAQYIAENKLYRSR